MDAIERFTEAVNRGDAAAALALLMPDASIVEDLAPFHWHGPGAGAAWLAGMSENAQRQGIDRIDMRLSRSTRVEVEGARAYAVVAGRLEYSFRQAPPLHAEGLLTFVLVKAG